MKRYLVLNRVCALTSMGALSLAYVLAGYWMIVPGFLVMTLFWISLKRWSAYRLSSVLLLIFIFLAAIGVTLDFSLPLLLIACTAALASWDLTNFAEIMNHQGPKTSLSVERFHLRSLAIAALTGLMLAFIALYVNLELPFGLTFILVLMALGSLTYGLRSVMKSL